MRLRIRNISRPYRDLFSQWLETAKFQNPSSLELEIERAGKVDSRQGKIINLLCSIKAAKTIKVPAITNLTYAANGSIFKKHSSPRKSSIEWVIGVPESIQRRLLRSFWHPLEIVVVHDRISCISSNTTRPHVWLDNSCIAFCDRLLEFSSAWYVVITISARVRLSSELDDDSSVDCCRKYSAVRWQKKSTTTEFPAIFWTSEIHWLTKAGGTITRVACQ